MTDEKKTAWVINPHDKVFQTAYSDLENASSFLINYLPGEVLNLVDLNTLEITKDSFIEKELAEYYSDILYKVNLTDGSQGFIYVLFEHKSHYDRFVHLQLLEYIAKIWRLYIKQHQGENFQLPIVIPLLICHAKKECPEDTVRMASLLSSPVEDLVGYIPDFEFELYDLHRFSNDEINGTIVSRVILLLLKHIRDPYLQQCLPDIFALLKTLVEKETGIEWIEVVIRYLTSAWDEEDLSAKKIVEIAEQAISKETGEYVMTLLEKLRSDGKQQAKLEGLRETIEMGITLKFPGDIEVVMSKVNKTDDLETLIEVAKTIYTANDISEILALLK